MCFPFNLQAIGLWKGGFSERKIQEKLKGKLSKTCIHQTIVKYKETGSVVRKPGSGRRRCTSGFADRKIVSISRRDWFKSATDIHRELVECDLITCTARTVRNRLLEKGLKSVTATRKFYLNKDLANKRIEFCEKVKDWSLDYWKKVLWSDESSFKVFNRKSKMILRRQPGEKYDIRAVKTIVQGGGGSVMVWGCFGGAGLGKLVAVDGVINSDKYIEVMEEAMLPSREQLYAGYCVYMQDNAPVHKSRKTMQWLRDNDVVLMDWPARSPDLNPIENLWSVLDQQLARNPPRGMEDLKAKLVDFWQAISPETIKNLVESMPKRVNACLKAKGWYFKA